MPIVQPNSYPYFLPTGAVVFEQSYLSKEYASANTRLPRRLVAVSASARRARGIFFSRVTEICCGCDFVNLKDNTTGLDNHFQYGDGFIVTRANNDKPEAQTIHSEVLNPKAVRKETRGIAAYCGTCKALMMLKVTGD